MSPEQTPPTRRILKQRGRLSEKVDNEGKADSSARFTAPSRQLRSPSWPPTSTPRGRAHQATALPRPAPPRSHSVLSSSRRRTTLTAARQRCVYAQTRSLYEGRAASPPRSCAADPWGHSQAETARAADQTSDKWRHTVASARAVTHAKTISKSPEGTPPDVSQRTEVAPVWRQRRLKCGARDTVMPRTSSSSALPPHSWERRGRAGDQRSAPPRSASVRLTRRGPCEHRAWQ